MFMLLVYYHDILRYTISGTTEKLEGLRNLKFFAEARPIPVRH